MHVAPVRRMIFVIIGIVTGALLIFQARGVGDAAARLSRTTRSFESAVGVVALVAGIVAVIDGPELLGVALILGGLILAAGTFTRIPHVGDELQHAGRALAAFRTVIGLIILLIAIAALF